MARGRITVAAIAAASVILAGCSSASEYDAVPEPTPPPAEETIDSSKLGG